MIISFLSEVCVGSDKTNNILIEKYLLKNMIHCSTHYYKIGNDYTCLYWFLTPIYRKI